MVVVGRGYVTEPLSKYLDWFLRPCLQGAPSFLLDTKTLLRNLDGLILGPGCNLATIDVVNLYTRIRYEDGIKAIRTLLNRTDKTLKCVHFICDALKFMLMHNAFRFGNEWYTQRVGMAIGTPIAPNFAKIFLALCAEKYIYSIDNPQFLEYININDINMQFTGNFGNDTVEFLDVQISIKD